MADHIDGYDRRDIVVRLQIAWRPEHAKPDIPGIGFEAKAALYRIMRTLAEG
jgi:hypothetical protein